MAKKITNWCKCYCSYPNTNHTGGFCHDFIRIKEPSNGRPGKCIRRGVFKLCEKCLNFSDCKVVWELAKEKDRTIWACTDFKE